MKKQQKRVRFSHIIGITFFLIILIGLLPLKLKGNNLGEVYAKTNQKKFKKFIKTASVFNEKWDCI